MIEIIHKIESFIPLLIIVSLTLFMSLERFIPFIKHSEYRSKQRWHNVVGLVLTFVLNATLSGIVSLSFTIADSNEFGLLRILDLPIRFSLIIGVFLCDLNGYIAHRLYHRVPLFWRFHRVHHSDTELDASSALRLHPFEFVFQVTTQATILPLLGVSGAAFVLYNVIALPLFIINHSNIKYATWYEKYVSLLFVTPNWHRVHHSSYQPETDSNYADVFSLWDRLFNTHKIKNPQDIEYGLETLREKKDQTFLGMLTTPFKPLKKG
jgi:sterol desaturase/sphingolipid hydroxylase (fatty acid hydroxylase superfamily)